MKFPTSRHVQHEHDQPLQRAGIPGRVGFQRPATLRVELSLSVAEREQSAARSSGRLAKHGHFELAKRISADHIFRREEDSLSAVGNDLADLTSKPSLTSGSLGSKINQRFTTGAFKTAAPGTFGNVGRNILSGPGTFTGLQRLFTIKERFKLQYRAEFFHGLNHTLLNNPGTTVTSGGFGRITSARDPRILQMALKIRF
jgi:hypothetical protein